MIVIVEEFAILVSSPNLWQIRSGLYLNSFGQAGYFACYRGPTNCFIKYSVSNTDSPVAPDEVAAAITAPGRWIQRAKPYLNRKGKQGFEATVLSGGHAYMFGVAIASSHFHW